jgi:hypothetical protein
MLETIEYTLLSMLLAQAVLMLFDEFHFHRKRGLEGFERWGHVADTMLFFAALCIPLLLVPTGFTMGLYIFFAVASSLFITKDEWIHASSCSGGEQWCHSLLFTLHGAILFAVGMIWHLDPSAMILRLLPLPVGIWALYQFFYWNVYYEQSAKKARDQQSLL